MSEGAAKTLVHENRRYTDGPSTHAVVIGVGAYAHLPGGPVCAEEEHVDCICPWCIADGSTHEQLGASFTDEDGIGGGGEWYPLPEKVTKEVACRTPGFSSWLQERW